MYIMNKIDINTNNITTMVKLDFSSKEYEKLLEKINKFVLSFIE